MFRTPLRRGSFIFHALGLGKPDMSAGFRILLCFLTFFSLFWTLYPDPITLFGDELFVFTERRWFHDRPLDWLLHLLPFNQSRFLWYGDGFLFRPGLFLLNFVLDALRAESRLYGHLAALALDAAAATGLVAIIARRTHWILGLVAGLLFFLPPLGILLHLWPHTIGYVAAAWLFVLGADRLDRVGDDRFDPQAAGLLFLAATCHEFAAVSLGLLWLAGAVHKRLRPSLAAPLALFAALALTSYATHWPLPFRDSVDKDRTVGALGEALVKHFGDLGQAFSPFGELGAPWLGVGVCFAALGLGLAAAGNGQGRFFHRACLTAFAALFALASVRMARRLVNPYYYPLLCYLLIPPVAATVHRLGRDRLHNRAVWLFAALAAVFIPVKIVQALETGAVVRAGAAAQAGNVGLVDSVKTSVWGAVGEPRRCYAGAFHLEPPRGPDTPLSGQDVVIGSGFVDLDVWPTRLMAAELLRETCAPGDGKTPLYAGLGAGRGGGFAFFAPSSDAAGLTLAPLDLLPDLFDPELRLHRMSPPNRRLARGERSEPPVQAFFTADARRFSRIEARFAFEEPWPEAPNVGIVLDYPFSREQFVFSAQDADAAINSAKADAADNRPDGGEPPLLATGTLPRMDREFTLWIARNGEGCLFGVDRVATAELRRCPDAPTRIGWMSYDNGTPPERLLSLRVAPPGPSFAAGLTPLDPVP